MIQADDLPPDALHGASAASAQLRAGVTFCTLVSGDEARRAAAVQVAIEENADLATRFLLIGNPLRAPLTLQRLMIQATGQDAEGSHELSPDERARLIAGPLGDESRVIAVIHQADTLDPDAVAALQEMEQSFRTGQPRVQVLFAGGPALVDLLAGRSQIPLPVPPPPAPPLAQRTSVQPAVQSAPVSPQVGIAPPTPWPVPPVPARSGRWIVFLVLLLLTLLAGAAAIVVLRPDLIARTGISLPTWITARLPAR